MMSESDKHWDHFYSGASKNLLPEIPSQFAAFVASEFCHTDYFIVDLGCGSGRDTKFFAKCGFPVLGIDSAMPAIDQCKLNINFFKNLHFLCATLSEKNIPGVVNDLSNDRSVILYARFFLHAITESDERDFFQLAKSICGPGGTIAVEFRTEKDEKRSKVTEPHYRRYINSVSFIERAESQGFSVQYAVEGLGFAKFKSDDAHVARVILQKNVELSA